VIVVVVAVVATSSTVHLDRILCYRSIALLFNALLPGECASYWWWAALLFDEWPFFLIPVKHVSFRWHASFRSTVLLATAFFVLVLRAIGLEIIKYRFKNIKSTMIIVFYFKDGTAYRRFDSSIPTASVDRYYTVIQTSNGCRGSLLSCQATWHACCWVCAMEDRKSILDTHSLIFTIPC